MREPDEDELWREYSSYDTETVQRIEHRFQDVLKEAHRACRVGAQCLTIREEMAKGLTVAARLGAFKGRPFRVDDKALFARFMEMDMEELRKLYRTFLTRRGQAAKRVRVSARILRQRALDNHEKPAVQILRVEGNLR